MKEWVKRCPNIKSLIQNINTRDTNVILGEKERTLYGPSVIKDSILGVDFLISSKSFFQVNPVQVEKLYRKALDFADLHNDENILDAYCGIGTISLCASKYVKKVTGVEIVKEAIVDAKKNAKLNNINNAEFLLGDAGDVFEELTSQGEKYSTVFVDPPRKGLDQKFIDTLLRLEPPKIIYVSCDPETLARDIKLLTSKYNIEDVQPVDMFPMTFHVETIVGLISKK